MLYVGKVFAYGMGFGETASSGYGTASSGYGYQPTSIFMEPPFEPPLVIDPFGQNLNIVETPLLLILFQQGGVHGYRLICSGGEETVSYGGGYNIITETRRD